MFTDALHSFIYWFTNASTHRSINPFLTLKYRKIRATLNMRRSTRNEVLVQCLPVRSSCSAATMRYPSCLHLYVLNRTKERLTGTADSEENETIQIEKALSATYLPHYSTAHFLQQPCRILCAVIRGNCKNPPSLYGNYVIEHICTGDDHATLAPASAKVGTAWNTEQFVLKFVYRTKTAELVLWPDFKEV